MEQVSFEKHKQILSRTNTRNAERKFQGTKVPRSEKSRERKFQGAKVLYMELSLPGANGLGSEKSSYLLDYGPANSATPNRPMNNISVKSDSRHRPQMQLIMPL